MRNSSQVYSWPKLLDMTPFPISHLGHNNQALTKRFAYQSMRNNIRALPKPKSQATRLKYANEVMTSRIGCTTNQPFGMHLRHVHVPTSSPCLPPLSGPSFLNPKVGVRFRFGPTQNSSICPMPFDNTICLIQISHDIISWKSLAFISLATWCGTFYVTLCPTERKVMSSSRSTSFLCQSNVEFFYGFLGMFHVGFIHPRCLYRMVSFPLN